VPELAAQRQPHDPVVYKGSEGEDGYSAFSLRDPRSGRRSATPLHALLQRQGVTALQLCGVATDWCVRATALDAVRLGYRVHLVDTAIAAVNLTPSDGTLAIEEMLASGVERVTGPARGSRSTAPR
jgi:nicotinamidase/pyrazinamidase